MKPKTKITAHTKRQPKTVIPKQEKCSKFCSALFPFFILEVPQAGVERINHFSPGAEIIDLRMSIQEVDRTS